MKKAQLLTGPFSPRTAQFEDGRPMNPYATLSSPRSCADETSVHLRAPTPPRPEAGAGISGRCGDGGSSRRK